MTDVQVFDQTDLENSITIKANKLLLIKDVEQDEKRLEKAIKSLNVSVKHINQLNSKLSHPRTKISEKKKIKDEIQWLEENELSVKQQDVQDIKSRIELNKRALEESKGGNEDRDRGGGRLPDESERDYLIRIGKITAFGNENAFQLVDATED